MKTPVKPRGSVLFRWFLSYLAILLIPLFLSMAVYFYSLRIINRNSIRIYEASLEQFRIEVDNFISGAFRILQQLALNSDIQTLTGVRGKLQPVDRWKIIQTIREFQRIKLIFPMIDDIFVVLNHQESIMNSAVYFPVDFYYRLYFENEAIGPEAFANMIKEPQKNQIVQVKDKLLLFLPSVEYIYSGASATFAICYKKEMFDNHFFNSYEANRGRIFIAQGQAVYGSGDTPPVFFGDDNPGYRVLSLDSRVTDWTYFYLIPENLEKANARRIQLFTFAGLFICSVFGLFFSYWLTRRNYDPVKKLMSVFGYHGKAAGGEFFPLRGEDEFRWMERKALDTQAALGSNLLALRKYFIHTLLEKPFDPVNGRPEMERYNINLKGEWNLAVIFKSGFSDPGTVLSENESEIINTLLQVITHIFAETTDNDFSIEMIDAGEHVAAIVNWSGDRDAFIARLEDKIEHTQQEAAEFLHFPVLTALGEPRRGMEGIYYSSLEARETLRYLDLKAGQTILHYHDIKYSGGKYLYAHETEQKLINLVRMGDFGAVCGLLRQIWVENSDPRHSGKMSRLLAYNLLGSLVKGMEQDLPPDDFLPQGFNLENIPLEDLAATLEKAAAEICKANLLLRQSKHENQLSGKVKKYIDENFRNPDINISITSFHFGMNPAYLSTIFRDETGTSLLEYITSLRIEEGKKLLRSGCDVNEAAEKCGFRGSTTFIRVFKKLTGVTPGQYREL